MNRTFKSLLNWALWSVGLYAVAWFTGLFRVLGIGPFWGSVLSAVCALVLFTLIALSRSVALLHFLVSGQIKEYLERIEKHLQQALESAEERWNDTVLSFTLQKMEGLFYIGQHKEAIALGEEIPQEYLEGSHWSHYARTMLMLLSHHEPQKASDFFEQHADEWKIEDNPAIGDRLDLGLAEMIYRAWVLDDPQTRTFFTAIQEESSSELRLATASFYLAHLAGNMGHMQRKQKYLEEGSSMAPELFYWKLH